MTRVAIALALTLAVQAGPAATQSAPAADEAPRAPSGKWVAEFEDTMCVLSRPYGAGAEGLHLGFRPLPFDDDIEIVLVLNSPGDDRLVRGRKAMVTLLPSGQAAEAKYITSTVTDGKRIVRLIVPREKISDVGSAASIRLSLDQRTLAHAALTNTAAAMRTIDACDDDLVRSWGFDPVALRSLSRLAEPIEPPQTWVSNDDYPPKALAEEQQGVVRMRWKVGVDGRVHDCVIVQSSGAPILDAASCMLITKRARYRPALDAAGKPVATPKASTFSWWLPTD